MPADSVEALPPRQFIAGKAVNAFNHASRDAYEAYIAETAQKRRRYPAARHNRLVRWLTGQQYESEAERSQARRTTASYVYYDHEVSGKLGLYKRAFRGVPERRVVKDMDTFDVIVQAHMAVGHSGESPRIRQLRSWGILRE